MIFLDFVLILFVIEALRDRAEGIRPLHRLAWCEVPGTVERRRDARRREARKRRGAAAFDEE